MKEKSIIPFEENSNQIKKRTLSEQEKDYLRYIKTHLDLGYREMGGTVPYSVVSDLLNPNKGKDSLLSKTFLALMLNVRRQFENNIQDGKLDTVIIKKIENYIQLLDPQKQIVPAGLLIQTNSKNYIQRLSDNQLNLSNYPSPLTLVYGGIKTGKTSTLQNFLHKLNQLDRNGVYIDLKDLIRFRESQNETLQEIDICNFILSKINEESKLKSNRKFEKAYNLEDFYKKLEDFKGEGSELYLLLDNTEVLESYLGGQKHLETFKNLISQVQKKDSKTLRIIIAMHSYQNSIPGSPHINSLGNSLIIQCNNFDEENVKHLLSVYDLEDKKLEKFLVEELNGHPYLCHIAIEGK